MELYPGGLTVQDRKNGHIPLHAAIVDGRSDDDDETVDGDDDDDNNDESLELLACVLQAFPAGSQIRDVNGYTPLEYAIAKRNFDQAKYLLKNHWGNFPKSKGNPILHAALLSDAPPDFLRLLISKVDRCAQEDMYGDLPLHTCIYNDMPYEVVEMILNAYPRALKVEDSRNILPLSLELQQEARDDVIRLLVQKYPRAVCKASSEGLLPIHYAVSNTEVTVDVLQFLKEQYPNGLTTVR
jgi:ankyrin repeat protein